VHIYWYICGELHFFNDYLNLKNKTIDAYLTTIELFLIIFFRKGGEYYLDGDKCADWFSGVVTDCGAYMENKAPREKEKDQTRTNDGPVYSSSSSAINFIDNQINNT